MGNKTANKIEQNNLSREAADNFPAAAEPTDESSSIDVGAASNFDNCHEVRHFPNGRLELLELGGAVIGRAIFEPGWHWQKDLQPMSDTASCLAPHLQYHVKGVMHVVMDDGTEFDCHPGDVSWLPEGHDAWTVGDEAAEVIDFHGMLEYAESRKKQAENNLHRLIAESPLPMLIHDSALTGKSLLLNDRFLDTIHCEADEITDIQSWIENVVPNQDSWGRIAKSWERSAALSAEKNSKVPPLEISCLCAAGNPCVFEVYLTRTGSQTIAVFVDTTKQLEIRNTLSYAATHDELTGLLNRRGYDERIKRIWEEARFSGAPVSAIMIDIDFFKQYNDHYGHAGGDLCLKSVATALNTRTDVKRCLVARLGGEEFGIILPDCTLSDATKIAKDICAQIEQLALPHQKSEVSSFVTLSLGVTTAVPSANTCNSAELLERADELMYRSKQGGRNRATCDDEIDEGPHS